MKSKLISIPYTVGIIKPHIALKDDMVEQIYQKLDEHNFEVFHQKRKILSKEEITNLFYPYKNQAFYGEIEEHMLTAESIIFLLINKIDKVYDPSKEMEVKLESPIIRWKQLLGHKNPETAKEQEPVAGMQVHNPETGELEPGPG